MSLERHLPGGLPLPNLNANLERFMRSLKEECQERMIFFGDESLRHAINLHQDGHARRFSLTPVVLH
jgi:hypothetical protein